MVSVLKVKYPDNSSSMESQKILIWKGHTRIIEVQFLALYRPPPYVPKSAQVLLSSGRLGAMATSVVSLFQCLATLW